MIAINRVAMMRALPRRAVSRACSSSSSTLVLGLHNTPSLNAIISVNSNYNNIIFTEPPLASWLAPVMTKASMSSSTIVAAANDEVLEPAVTTPPPPPLPRPRSPSYISQDLETGTANKKVFMFIAAVWPEVRCMMVVPPLVRSSAPLALHVGEWSAYRGHVGGAAKARPCSSFCESWKAHAIDGAPPG